MCAVRRLSEGSWHHQAHRRLHVETVDLGGERPFPVPGLEPRVLVLAAHGAVFIELDERAVLQGRLGTGFEGSLRR
jgi:hypothetical protein